MAGEPKRRHSKARKRTRRAAINLAVNSVTCKNCNKLTLSHIVCKDCGFYGGKAVKKSLPAGRQENVKVTRA